VADPDSTSVPSRLPSSQHTRTRTHPLSHKSTFVCLSSSVAVQFPITFLYVWKLFRQCHHQLEIGKKTWTIKSPLVINNVNGESLSSCCLLLLLCGVCVSCVFWLPRPSFSLILDYVTYEEIESKTTCHHDRRSVVAVSVVDYYSE
jgi:hypothetical protein